MTAVADLLDRLASDIEERVREQYGHPDVHPALEPKFHLDMQDVYTARACAAALRRETGTPREAPLSWWQRIRAAWRERRNADEA